MIDFTNVRLNVVFVGIGHNDHLCYMENFRSINRSSRFILTPNKDPKTCASEKKVCSLKCDQNYGCWGPDSHHCFKCRHWRAGDDCVVNCQFDTVRRNFFTPLTGRVCGRCHESCRHGCFGAGSEQCYHSLPEENEYCLKHMYFNNTTRKCEDCSSSCFGAAHQNRSRVTIRACRGSGSERCSFRCPVNTFLTITPNGLFECIPGKDDDYLLGSRDVSLKPCNCSVNENPTVPVWLTVILTLLGVIVGILIQYVIPLIRRKLSGPQQVPTVVVEAERSSLKNLSLTDEEMTKSTNAGTLL